MVEPVEESKPVAEATEETKQIETAAEMDPEMKAKLEEAAEKRRAYDEKIKQEMAEKNRAVNKQTEDVWNEFDAEGKGILEEEKGKEFLKKMMEVLDGHAPK